MAITHMTLTLVGLVISFMPPTTAYDALRSLTAINSGEDPPISSEDRAVIEFWTYAGAVNNETQCSVGYLRQLQHRIEVDIRNTQLQDVIELYYLAELDLLSACGDRVANLATDYLDRLFRANRNLRMVVSEFGSWKHEADQIDRREFLSLAEWMFLTVGIRNAHKEADFVNAWDNGPCQSVIDTMSLPWMEPFAEFVEMIDETEYNPRKLMSRMSYSLVWLVQCCRYFQDEDNLIRAWVFLQSSDLYRRLIDQASRHYYVRRS